MKLVLLGKPLSGKGTQAVMLSKKLKIPTISVGEILRKEIKRNSSLGRKAKKFVEDGNLVPDNIILPLVKNDLIKKDFILDGFPRDLEQARALEKISSLDLVIDIYCTNALIRKRILARKSCNKCGKIYGLDVKPVKKGICKCGGVLVKREDDNLKTVKERLAIYKKRSVPLIDFYKRKGKYKKVSGEKDISIVYKQILKLI